jgi:large subunit ribosomal protein L4
MKVKVVTLENKAAGEIELDKEVFGLEVRNDLLHRMVEYQRAKKRAGTHKTKGVSEISGTTKKPWKQKGTGNARAGSLRSPQFRGGATIFGPVVRSHALGLNKKFRKLAMKHALSAKHKEGTLFIIENTAMKDAKTKAIAAAFEKNGWNKPLIIGGSALDEQFAKAARNIKHVDVLPLAGANVYDILRHKQLVLTKDAVKHLEESGREAQMSTKAKKKETVGVRQYHYDVIVSPVITEKSTAASEQGKFLFNVSLDAGKQDIKSAVEALFKVKVMKVNTLTRLGKTKRFRNTVGKHQDTKRAIVTLAEGQSIDLSAGVN